MKKILLFLSICAIGTNIIAQDCECYPKEGLYTYYVNMKSDKIGNKFSKDSLVSILNANKKNSSEKIKYFKEIIKEAKKSFPTAKTKLLKHSITLKSANPNLDKEFNIFDGEINFIEKICDTKNPLTYEPNDYRIGGSTYCDHLDFIKAPQAWEITKGDPRILIGITDTYIEPTHDEFKYQISQILQNSSAQYHGVAVSGCAAGHTDNNIGMSAVGFNSKIVFSSNWGNVEEVLRIAQIPGVRVINCSWLSCYPLITEEAAYTEIRDIHNVVVTAGAGNYATQCGSTTSYVYPASYDAVISVTSVGHSNERGTIAPDGSKPLWKDCHESYIGDKVYTFHHNDKVDICAPGYRVTAPNIGNSYRGDCWGTSFSAPMVAGACALVASVNPCLTAAQIQNIVVSAADSSIYNIPENADYIGKLGKGRLDVYAAVKKALELGTIYVQNKSYSGNYEESAQTEIKAGYAVTNSMSFGNVVINTGSNVTFKATRNIELSDGFEVQAGATFNAEVNESQCFNN